MDLFLLKYLAGIVLTPTAGSLYLALLGLVASRWRPRLGQSMVVAGLAIGWLFATPMVTQRLAAGLEAGLRPFDAAAWREASALPKPPRAIVVLGGGAVVDGPFLPKRAKPAPLTVQRTLAGARVARLTGLPLLVTGGTPPWIEESEAALMQRMLIDDLGLRARWVEDRARDTAENAEFSARALKADGIDSVILVTHAYHMARARRAFEAAGLAVVPAAHDWITGPAGGFEASDLLPSHYGVQAGWLTTHEFLGAWWYRLRGG